MRTIGTMAAKDLRLMSRDRVGMFFILAFPILMAVLFGLISRSFSTSNATLSVAVVDDDHSTMSARFVQALQESGHVQVERLDRSQALDRVRRGKLLGMIVLPPGFGETAGIFWADSPAIEIGVDPSRTAESGLLEGLVMQSMGQLVAVRFQDPDSYGPFLNRAREQLANADGVSATMRPLLQALLGSLDSLLDSLKKVQQKNGTSGGAKMPEMQLARVEKIDVTAQEDPNSPQALVKKIRSGWDISFPSSTMWGVLGCAAGFAVSLVRERTKGTLTRLQIAPITERDIVAGKAVACFLAVILVVAVLVALGVMLGMRPRHPAQLVLAAVSIAACFVGVMMLMSVIGHSEEAVSGAVWCCNIVMAMFGGGMVPLAFMPGFMRTISNFSPVKWGVLAMEGAIWRGLSWTEMLLPCGILVAIGGLCFTAGVIRFRQLAATV